jgi:hypothetical protein
MAATPGTGDMWRLHLYGKTHRFASTAQLTIDQVVWDGRCRSLSMVRCIGLMTSVIEASSTLGSGPERAPRRRISERGSFTLVCLLDEDLALSKRCCSHSKHRATASASSLSPTVGVNQSRTEKHRSRSVTLSCGGENEERE